MDYILFTVCIQLVAAGGFLLYPLLLTAALPAMASAAKYRTAGFSQCQYKEDDDNTCNGIRHPGHTASPSADSFSFLTVGAGRRMKYSATEQRTIATP